MYILMVSFFMREVNMLAFKFPYFEIQIPLFIKAK